MIGLGQNVGSLGNYIYSMKDKNVDFLICEHNSSYKRRKSMRITQKLGTFVSVEVCVTERPPLPARWFGLRRFEAEGGRK